MSLLLDTHALLWWLNGDPLSEAAIGSIAAEDGLVVVSAVSIWEAEIKAAIGKLSLQVDLVEESAVEGFEPLPVTLEHARDAGRLPPHHRDPFDRMLAAQALAENLTLVTRDEVFTRYAVDVLPC
ncbi:type II toxin-antitoxin system VapC family toxin [Euzebya tangerina]|uniref:type II toxin-antitoxin system VapC family toxin n=1 Tax=Euzebya tangerina TaxID=591198 RepID=UPI000E317297|nr:type II toxin-antitoxin system VapC family toxin [Euzebya tangerina]